MLGVVVGKKKEMNYRQKEPQIGSISVENTGLLKEWQLVWLGGEARDVIWGWVWTAWGLMEEHSCFVLEIGGRGYWRFLRG